MKKRVLITGIFSLLCAGKVFCDGLKELFIHARKYHRCLLDDKDVGYACPLCCDKVLVPGKSDPEDNGKIRVRIGKVGEKFRHPGCPICEIPEQDFRSMEEDIRFVLESFHMTNMHSRCFVCFEDFNKLFVWEIKDHLWDHGVCKECDYEKVEEKDKEAHLKNKHWCDCLQLWSCGHTNNCSSRWLWCDKHSGLCPIGYFQKEHRCNERCEIRYDSKSRKNVIFHCCYVKYPGCLKDVPAVHVDDVEKCSKICRSVDGSGNMFKVVAIGCSAIYVPIRLSVQRLCI